MNRILEGLLFAFPSPLEGLWISIGPPKAKERPSKGLSISCRTFADTSPRCP